MRRTVIVLLMIGVLCAIAVGCSSGASSTTSDQDTSVSLPKYTLVDDNDVSIPGTTRLTYWVAVAEQIDDSVAESIAKTVSADERDIDEVTVWIYDNVEGAETGMIWDQMYEVNISKGKVTEVRENPDYNPDYEFGTQASEEENTQTDRSDNQTSTVVTEDETSSILYEDEYYIYENGEAVAALSDFGETSFFFSVPSIDNDDYEIVVDFEGREITTKRGLNIGSTIREFVNAHKYCEIALVDQDLITTAEDFLENIDAYNLEIKYVITMSTNYTNDGQILCRSEWKQYVEDNDIDITDYCINPQNYCEKAFRIDFMVEDNMISNIIISDVIATSK